MTHWKQDQSHSWCSLFILYLPQNSDIWGYILNILSLQHFSVVWEGRLGERQQIMDYFNCTWQLGQTSWGGAYWGFHFHLHTVHSDPFSSGWASRKLWEAVPKIWKRFPLFLPTEHLQVAFTLPALSAALWHGRALRTKKKVLNASSCVTLTIYREATKCQSSWQDPTNRTAEHQWLLSFAGNPLERFSHNTCSFLI